MKLSFSAFAQVAASCLAAIFSVVIIGLGSDLMAFTTYYFNADTAHKHNDDARIQYEVTLDHPGYHPWDMPYTRPSLLVAVGTISVLLNVIVAAFLIKRRQPKLDIIGVDVLLLLLTLASTIYAWWPDFDPITAHHYRRPMAYAPEDGPVIWLWHHKDTIFDPVNWFCALWPFIPQGDTTYDETVSACREGKSTGVSFHGFVLTLLTNSCTKGNALLDLTIVLVLMQAIALAVHVWGFSFAKKEQKKIDEKIAEESD